MKEIEIIRSLLLPLGLAALDRASQIDAQKSIVAKLRVTRAKGSTENAATLPFGILENFWGS